MAINDNKDLGIPSLNSPRKSESLLPRYFRTTANKKFLQATVDQLISEGSVEHVNGYIGRKYTNLYESTDQYMSDVTRDRSWYQLEPAIVIKDDNGNVTMYKDYLDYINRLNILSNTTVDDRVANSQEMYSWDPCIDFDKLVNYRDYYWLPNGPKPVVVSGEQVGITSTYTVTVKVTDGVAGYVFTPDGLTVNPILKLYRGNTYRFVVNCPGHPISFKTHVIDGTAGTWNVGVSGQFVENGEITFTVPTNSPNTLYYVSKEDSAVHGMFTLYNADEATTLDVESEILGKKTYTTSSGVELIDGLRIKFKGQVIPEKYSAGTWYVEGVGDQIKLVSDRDLLVPRSYDWNDYVEFDSDHFDTQGFDVSTNNNIEKEYITINRASEDGNLWSRANRWFHESVVAASGNTVSPDARAARPIIEFVAGLQLWNHGTSYKKAVDFHDDISVDVFSLLEGAQTLTIDGMEVFDGARVLFTADKSVDVNGRIFQVKKFKFNGVDQLAIVPTEDSIPHEGESVMVTYGAQHRGTVMHYANDQWVISQNKQARHQFPLFDVVDSDGISLGDGDYYVGSSFNGTTVFQYAIGSNVDPIIDFGVKYKTIDNVGDLLFNFTYNQDVFAYQTADGIIQRPVSTGFMKINRGSEHTLHSGWVKSYIRSTQAVIQQILADTQYNFFEVTAVETPTALTESQISVTVNGVQQTSLDYTLYREDGRLFLRFFTDVTDSSSVVIKIQSDLAKTADGFYEIPTNLENNPFNERTVEFTLGQVSNHVNTIASNIMSYEALLTTDGALLNRGNVSKFGTKVVQHASSLVPVMYHIASEKYNVVAATKFAKDEYRKFKNNFIRVASDLGFDGLAHIHVDKILDNITSDKNASMPFYFSDMVPFGPAKVNKFVAIDASTNSFPLPAGFDPNEIGFSALTVYKNNQILAVGSDYYFDLEGFVTVKEVEPNDAIDLHFYKSTFGSYIPPTPTKLGLFPAYCPHKFLDTSYSEPTEVIMGHDGSITVAFGDYRDDLLLELETRIYNNLKVKYDPELFSIHEYVGNAYRKTSLSTEALNSVMRQDFLQWVQQANAGDYTVHDFYDSENPFTYNYSKFKSYKGDQLPGFWREIYKMFYDSDIPHIAPWNCLGLTVKPEWWDDTYGPAPYTSANLLLWKDIQTGTLRKPNRTYVRHEFAKPDIMEHLPVDAAGNLVDPLTANLVAEYSKVFVTGPMVFGDGSPIETAWRRSSDYAFSLTRALLTLAPASVFSTGYDRIRQVRDTAGQIVYRGPSDVRFNLKDVVLPEQNGRVFNYTSGLVNWIADYATSKLEPNFDSLKNDFKSIKVNLGTKLAGFTSKNKFKLVLENKSPQYNSVAYIPEENYDIFLNTSSAISSLTYSGVIVEKTNEGFVVKGYSTDIPEFKYFEPLETVSDSVISVGGISESFVDWVTNNYYEKGAIVRYNSEYYRVTASHKSGVFDDKFYAFLLELPIYGGRRAVVRTRFASEVSIVHYGTVFTTIQEVVDFLLGYGAYLESLGFVFDYHNEITSESNTWKSSVREFMFWTTQNWSTGAAISLSPTAYELKLVTENAVVDNLLSNDQEYSILKSTGQVLEPSFTNSLRDDNVFSLRPTGTNDGIYFAVVNLVQKEHVLIIDNQTVFSDVIYDQAQGYRRDRILVSGYRTTNWTGGYKIPGMVYDQAVVTDWAPWADYSTGDTVKHKEFYYSATKNIAGKEEFDYSDWIKLNNKPESKLIPNWDYRAKQFQDFYELETDSFDAEQQKFAQHAIGYQPRQYLANIIPNEVAQYKFYQGMIKDKGTMNALDKLFGPMQQSNRDALTFFEEWAIRVGHYGATDAFTEVDVVIDEALVKLNPQAIVLSNANTSTFDRSVYEVSSDDVFVYGDKPHLPLSAETNFYVKTAGYVKESDVDYVVSSEVELLSNPTATFKVGQTLWVANANGWDVKRLSLVDAPVYAIDKVQNQNIFDVKFGTALSVNPGVGSIVIIDTVGFDFDTTAEVLEVSNDKITVKMTVPFEKSKVPANYAELTRVLTFVSQRVKPTGDIFNLDVVNRNTGDLVWVDGANDYDWSVWKYARNEGQLFIQADTKVENIVANNACNLLAVSSSNSVKLHTKLPNGFCAVKQEIEIPDQATVGFGTSIVFSADDQSLYIAENSLVHVYTASDNMFNYVESVYFGSEVKKLVANDIALYVSVQTGLIAYANGVQLSVVAGEVSDVTAFEDAIAYSVAGKVIVSGSEIFEITNDSYENDADFGKTIALTKINGELTVATSAPNAKVHGAVIVATATEVKEVNRVNLTNSYFGEQVFFTATNDLIVVSNVDREKVVQTIDAGNTTFDLDATTFSEYMFADKAIYMFNSELKFVESLLPVEPSLEFGDLLTVNELVIAAVDNKIYAYTTNPVWNLYRESNKTVDVRKVKTAFLYDTETSQIIQRLDCVDVLKGKILGIADQEISFKTPYDPAVYASGTNDEIIVDETDFWADEFVGKLWWDINSAMFTVPYQDSVVYSANLWNTVFKDQEVKVYEWVKSTVHPEMWDQLSGTEQGHARGISGKTKYGNSAYTEIPVYSASGNVASHYYFWVERPTYVPAIPGRRISASDVAMLIQDPKNAGEKFIQYTGENSFSLVNCGNLLNGRKVALNIQYWNFDNSSNIHTHYELLAEGDSTSEIPKAIEQKWFDSLVGTDVLGRDVPDTSLPEKVRYGIQNRPRQGMFINRLEALKQFIERVNRITERNVTVDRIKFDKMTSKLVPPAPETGKYDLIVSSIDDLEFITLGDNTTPGIVNSFTPAVIDVVIEDGSITSVVITDAGSGYGKFRLESDGVWYGPVVEVVADNFIEQAELQTYIDEAGSIVKVDVVRKGAGYSAAKVNVRPLSALVEADAVIGGRWAIYTYDADRKKWSRTETQTFNIDIYWDYSDWYADGYNPFVKVKYEVDFPYQLSTLVDIADGDVVRVDYTGTTGWSWYVKVPSSQSASGFTLVAQQNATIKFSDSLYQYTVLGIGYDSPLFDIVPYDVKPDAELRMILEMIRDDILVDDLKVEYNKLFFSSLRYALSEQVFIDWAFKTSFVRSVHHIGGLDQPKLYRSDNLSDYVEYVKEVKPYRTKIREFTTAFDRMEISSAGVTDFDLPTTIQNGQPVTIQTSIVDGLVETNLPLSNNMVALQWEANAGSPVVEIIINDGGEGYTVPPVVDIVGLCNEPAVAKAYIKGGKIVKVVLEQTGSGYLSTPTVEINGSVGDRRHAKLTAVLGVGTVRSNIISLKFDRVSKVYEKTNKRVKHVLQPLTTRQRLPYPANTVLTTVNVVVNGVELISSEYTLSNEIETVNGIRVEYGQLVTTVMPTTSGDSYIEYEINDSMLTAADRIYHYYEPLPGMPGKDLSQLMTGVEYSGVRVLGNDELGSGSYDVAINPTDGFTPDELHTIIDGGKFVSEIDCPSVEELVSGKIQESIRVIVDGKYSLFKDMFGNAQYREMPYDVLITDNNGGVTDDHIVLTQELNMYDTEIHVSDATDLVDPAAMNKPGAVFIGKERIEYRVKDGNVLRKIVRGTSGTTPKSSYEVGTVVEVVSYNYAMSLVDDVLVDQHVFTSNDEYVIIELQDFDIAGATTDDGTGYGQCNDVEVVINGKKLTKAAYEMQDVSTGELLTVLPEYQAEYAPNERVTKLKVKNIDKGEATTLSVIKRVTSKVFEF